ncbi:DMT family transporter [Psychrobacillus sp. NEAU-3TGS]|uniref:DMT family transporter n=1 Tax=Psychrobacillus sp. NEAU-3TGS TaxID=2995412 RepID=UPI0024977A8A|nr:DMT family transporter [Psychrobacillus sp. NEAU-3TGS]MDI2585860.1 DMT family transporter [Psychrobacillus sp. NEAU-3TGS]
MKSIIYLIVLSFLWGSAFMWTKELLDVFKPPTIVFFRCLFGLVALLPFILLKKNRMHLKIRPFFVFVLALGAAIPWNIMAFSLQGIDTSLSGILNATTPLFALLFSIVILKTKPSWNQTISLLIGFVAVTVLILFSSQSTGVQFSIFHAFLMFAVTMAYALNSIWIKKYYTSIPTILLGFWTLLISTIVNGIISAFMEPYAYKHLGTWETILPLLVLGCLCAGLGYVIFYQIISIGGPILASMVTFVSPFITIALGIFFLQEPFHLGIVIGLPLMILSLLLMNIHIFKRDVPLIK